MLQDEDDDDDDGDDGDELRIDDGNIKFTEVMRVRQLPGGTPHLCLPLAARHGKRAHAVLRSAGGNSSSSPADATAANVMAGLFVAWAQQVQQPQESQPGADVVLHKVSFHPPGSDKPLLDSVSMKLPANQMGLIVGRSGSGKTTLLQLLSGLCEQSSGNLFIGHVNSVPSSQPGMSPLAVPQLPPLGAAGPIPALPNSSMEERMARVGLVFQVG